MFLDLKISDKKRSTSDVESSTSDVIFGKNFASGLSFSSGGDLEEYFCKQFDGIYTSLSLSSLGFFEHSQPGEGADSAPPPPPP